MEEKTTFTAEELQEKINEAVEKAVAEKESELKKQHDSDMAQARQKAKADKDNAVAKAKEDAKLTAEELAKRDFEEKQRQEHEELVALRQQVRANERTEKLVNAGVPKMFAHDSRLLNAEDEQVDSVIATIKSEWEQLNPKGKEIVSTNVGGNTTKKSQEETEFERFRNLGFHK